MTRSTCDEGLQHIYLGDKANQQTHAESSHNQAPFQKKQKQKNEEQKISKEIQKKIREERITVEAVATLSG